MYRQAIIVGAALCFAACNVHAESNGEQTGWYVGLGLGRSRLDIGSSDIDAALAAQGIVAAASLHGERNDSTVDIFGGYRVARNFAVELGLNHLGDFNYNATVLSAQGGVIQGTYETRAVSLSAVGILPLQAQWSLYGKLGAAAVGARLTGDAMVGSTSVSTTDHTDVGLLVGVGATYGFEQGVFARLEFDEYPRVGNNDTGKASLGLFELGLGYRF